MALKNIGERNKHKTNFFEKVLEDDRFGALKTDKDF